MTDHTSLWWGVAVTAVCAVLWIRRRDVFAAMNRQRTRPVDERLLSICCAGGAVGGLLIVLGAVLQLFA